MFEVSCLSDGVNFPVFCSMAGFLFVRLEMFSIPLSRENKRCNDKDLISIVFKAFLNHVIHSNVSGKLCKCYM